MFKYAKELIQNLGYEEYFTGVQPQTQNRFIANFNKENLEKSIYQEKVAEDITSIFINYPALLLRKKSILYPEGRTSYRFKRTLRKKVTIVDKSSHNNSQEHSAA